jgi:hypothetical protein
VPAPSGPITPGNRVVAITLGPYARHRVGTVLTATPTGSGTPSVIVYADQPRLPAETFPADTVFAIPAAERYVPRTGDSIVLSVPTVGDDEDADIEPAPGTVSRILASARVVVDTEAGVRTVEPGRLAVDDRVEPGSWVVLPDGTTGSVVASHHFRVADRQHSWGYDYTVAVPHEPDQQFKAWSRERFDAFLVATVNAGRVTAHPVRT